MKRKFEQSGVKNFQMNLCFQWHLVNALVRYQLKVGMNLVCYLVSSVCSLIFSLLNSIFISSNQYLESFNLYHVLRRGNSSSVCFWDSIEFCCDSSQDYLTCQNCQSST